MKLFLVVCLYWLKGWTWIETGQNWSSFFMIECYACKTTKIITVVSASDWRSILCIGKDSARNWRKTAISYPRYIVHSKFLESNFPFLILLLQSLPQHYHVYHVTENQSTTDELVQPSGMGLLLYRIAFTHPRHIPKMIEVRHHCVSSSPPPPPPSLAAQHELWWDSR